MAKERIYSYKFTNMSRARGYAAIVQEYPQVSQQISVRLNDDALLQRRRSSMNSTLADLVDIGVAVMVADRLATGRENHTCELHLTVPVRNPAFFSQLAIHDELCDVLHFFSDDTWVFTFPQRTGIGRHAELQGRIDDIGPPVEVALWSGGLDGMAGLYERLDQRLDQEYTLFSVGNSRYIQGVQRSAARTIHKAMPHARVKTEQIPFQIDGIGRRATNPSPRTRGFVFLVLGSVGAYLEGQSSLYVYENGVGAINLPYRETAIRRDHSHAVHPVALCRVASWISAVLQEPFRIVNPFLFSTKAEVCRSLIANHRLELITAAITCDRRRRSRYLQCGRCSSCLLRRQALAVYDIDEGGYAVPEERRAGRAYRAADGDFLRAMCYQVERLRKKLATNDPWHALATSYSDLPQIVRWLNYSEGWTATDVQTQLVNLYRRYVAEWDIPGVRARLGQHLLTQDELVALMPDAQQI